MEGTSFGKSSLAVGIIFSANLEQRSGYANFVRRRYSCHDCTDTRLYRRVHNGGTTVREVEVC